MTQLYRQTIDGCLERRIGKAGLNAASLAAWTGKLETALDGLRADYATGALPVLRIAEETADIEAAERALARLSTDARNILFFGTGGSGLGGQTLAQLGGWNIPFAATTAQRRRPRVRFYDNLDGGTLAGALSTSDLETTRFVVTSKSGSTTETLAQAIAALSAVKTAGLEHRIPEMFLGITEPAKTGKSNGLRDLFEAHGIPLLDHHAGIGGRFSCLTNVGLLPALARGLDVRAIRAGAAGVVKAMLDAKSPADFAPAVGAATIIALSKERGIRTIVMMPYTDRLGKFSEWFVQLWAESLGKGGEGTTPIPALGPLDQHSQLQLFMDGPPEIAVTLVRVNSEGQGPVLDPAMADKAGVGFVGGKTVGDVVSAQAHAIEEALAQAKRPVRTIDIPKLNEMSAGALLMHFMIETILAGRLLGLDPFDQPAVELVKVLTRERLSKT